MTSGRGDGNRGDGNKDQGMNGKWERISSPFMSAVSSSFSARFYVKESGMVWGGMSGDCHAFHVWYDAI